MGVQTCWPLRGCTPFPGFHVPVVQVPIVLGFTGAGGGCEMSSLEKELRSAAIRWWENRRPLQWSQMDHVRNPAINTSTAAERDLACVVAKIVERAQ